MFFVNADRLDARYAHIIVKVNFKINIFHVAVSHILCGCHNELVLICIENTKTRRVIQHLLVCVECFVEGLIENVDDEDFIFGKEDKLVAVGCAEFESHACVMVLELLKCI